LNSQLIYDHNTKIDVNSNKKDAAGIALPSDLRQSRVQFREALGVSISYKFSSKD